MQCPVWMGDASYFWTESWIHKQCSKDLKDKVLHGVSHSQGVVREETKRQHPILYHFRCRYPYQRNMCVHACVYVFYEVPTRSFLEIGMAQWWLALYVNLKICSGKIIINIGEIWVKTCPPLWAWLREGGGQTRTNRQDDSAACLQAVPVLVSSLMSQWLTLWVRETRGCLTPMNHILWFSPSLCVSILQCPSLVGWYSLSDSVSHGPISLKYPRIFPFSFL